MPRFIKLSSVPSNKRAIAQGRVVREGIIAHRVTEDKFRVKASDTFLHPSVPFGVLNSDFYEVTFFESDGDLYTTCSCPFGTSDGAEPNVCKHIESAVAQRGLKRATRMPSSRQPSPLKIFGKGTVTIQFTPNNFEVKASFQNELGGRLKSDVRFDRQVVGEGQSLMESLIEELRSGY